MVGLENSQTMMLGAYQASVAKRLADWQAVKLGERLWSKDPTVWFDKPTPEITNRLGWLTLPQAMRGPAPEIMAFAKEAKGMFRHVVVLGMGGSSLAPDVFARTFGPIQGYPSLTILDSTHPDAVSNIQKSVDLACTLFVVSSKSGTTIEPLSFFRYFWARLSAITKTPGDHFVAITDPGSTLIALAEQRKFRKVFLATPDVGGRYSALTAFGLVPAALMGLDLGKVLDKAQTMAEACGPLVPAADNPALVLGAALGEMALAHKDKVTLITDPVFSSFPDWVEQLVAESVGKDGKGIVPVVGEAVEDSTAYGSDRLFVYIKSKEDGRWDKAMGKIAASHPTITIALAQSMDLCQEFFRWELAVAAAGAVTGIHPFDQPDVELAKELARAAMKKGATSQTGGATGQCPSAENAEALTLALKEWTAKAQANDYIAIQAYLAFSEETDKALQTLRRRLADRLGIATTLGYGPRFLHSTGQLHKGGPNSGLFLQIIDKPAQPLAVAETDYTFAQLICAQAQGDFQALLARGRRCIQIDVGPKTLVGLARLIAAF